MRHDPQPRLDQETNSKQIYGNFRNNCCRQNIQCRETNAGTETDTKAPDLHTLRSLSRDFGFSIESAELQIIDANWYVTHTGLLRLARRKRCRGIHVEAVDSLCDSAASRYVLKATVYPSKGSAGFVGYGDADPSNVSLRVRGAEMRMAETRAVNRALRKAYGIGICSVEEIGSFPGRSAPGPESQKIPPKNANGNGNGSGHKVRDRLCQIIRQHKLDPELVKAYAVDFCGTKALKDATREQVESFVQQLAEAAKKDRAHCFVSSTATPVPTRRWSHEAPGSGTRWHRSKNRRSVCRTASSSSASTMPNTAGMRRNRFMCFGCLSSSPSSMPGARSSAGCTAPRRRCGSWVGFCAIFSMTRSR